MRSAIITTLLLCGSCVLAFGQSTNNTTNQQPSAVTTAPAPVQNTNTPPAPPKKKHVYTSEDFKPANPNDTPSASAAADSGSSAAGASGVTPAKDDKSAKSKAPAKKADQAAIDKQQAKVDNLKQQVDGETKVIADIQRLIDQEPSRAAGMGAGLAKQQTDLVQMKKDLTDAQSQLDAMKNPK
jgi:hypothetical protein